MLLFIVVAGAAVTAGLALRASSAIGSIQTLSQPPPSLPGTTLGASAATVIDTGPAQRALATNGDASSYATTDWWGSVQRTVGGVPDAVSGVAVASGAQTVTPLPLTILLLGVDARPGEPIDVGVRSDAILLLRLDPETRSCRLLAIPRDTRVELPGYGLSKINHALAVGGVPYQTEVVEGFLSIEVDRFVLADFRGFAEAVDAIGGVTITVPESFATGEMTFAAGEQRLTGEQALAYVRYRGGADGDFGRVARQQQVLRAIVEQGSSIDAVWGVGDILRTIEAHIRTDLSPLEISSLVAYYQAPCGSTEIEMATLTGETGTFPDPLVGAELSYVVVSDADKAAQIAYLFGDDE